MRVLMVGDVVGKPGRQAVAHLLPQLQQRHRLDLVIVNGENAAGGVGLTPPVADELFGYGIDVITSGNHIWSKTDIMETLDSDYRILRPANYPSGVPGTGSSLISARSGQRVGIINVEGRVFSNVNLDCPFRRADEELELLKKETNIIVIDVHAEATSEKVAFGWHMNGRASAVIGTHTHVQTADARILSQGTAYMTDAGMTGPVDSVIGVKQDAVLERFLYQLPVRFEVAKGDKQLNGVIIDIDDDTGKATAIMSVNEMWSSESS